MRDQSRDGLQRTTRRRDWRGAPAVVSHAHRNIIFPLLTPVCYDVGASAPVDSALL